MFSNVLEGRCRPFILRSLLLGCITSDGATADILASHQSPDCASGSPNIEGRYPFEGRHGSANEVILSLIIFLAPQNASSSSRLLFSNSSHRRLRSDLLPPLPRIEDSHLLAQIFTPHSLGGNPKPSSEDSPDDPSPDNAE